MMTDTFPPMPDFDAELARLADWTGTPEDAAAHAIGIYRAAAAVAAAMKVFQDGAKAAIGDLIAETGTERWDTEAGIAVLTSPSVRTSWDAKALDALCASDDTIARVLAPHRRETMVAGSVTVKGATR
jgi:hypothetical protein